MYRSLLSFSSTKNRYLQTDRPADKQAGTKGDIPAGRIKLRDCKRRQTGLAMGWIDHQKHYDMVAHSWMLRCSGIFKIADNVRDPIKSSMMNWETELTSEKGTLGTVKIRLGIFQGDSLSRLL